ncbi:O-antigen ligase family protein [Sphingobium phenoxybenzoativorans]|uniref:O-antigen ligase family protein n=1 Tax=Sphingobium phenoxybenzoativorans TaxID=1592790 RepID=A0A975Q1H2_9SPHN|nr:O-antigen ligase family protein [Sphingobium phenoxybenzoativorans]QUT05666.1 O-antigen ligase family protein [Sphingobium phenoxybenzoativorans]
MSRDFEHQPYPPMRLRKTAVYIRNAAPIISEYESLAIQAATLGVIATLAYKAQTLCLLLMAFLISRIHKIGFSWINSRLPAVLGVIYVALATVTALFVSQSAGIYRTLQFFIVILSTFVMVGHIFSLDQDKLYRFIKYLSILCIAIMIHIIFFHVSTNRIFTWKYLYDTKIDISLCIIILFIFEDKIKGHSRILWGCALIALITCVLMSGERKAYLLFIAIWAISNSPWQAKLVGLLTAVLAISIFLAASSKDSYVARQINSFSHSTKEIPTRYFFSVSSIGDQSDLVREFVNRNARLLFKSNPVFGLGATGYGEWAQKTYGNLKQSSGRSMNVHGEINRIPVENGLVGIFGVVLYLASCLFFIFNFVNDRGLFRSSSMVRGVLYLYIFMICYNYSEAMDTTMMVLIAAVGLIAAGLPRSVHSPREAAHRLNRLAKDSAAFPASTTMLSRGERPFGLLRKRRNLTRPARR